MRRLLLLLAMCGLAMLMAAPALADSGGAPATVVTPDQAIVTPDQAVVTPDQAVVTPDQGALPGTGGAPVLLPMAGALLVAGGLLSVGLLRRR